jgi:hypothetical protein
MLRDPPPFPPQESRSRIAARLDPHTMPTEAPTVRPWGLFLRGMVGGRMMRTHSTPIGLADVTSL